MGSTAPSSPLVKKITNFPCSGRAEKPQYSSDASNNSWAKVSSSSDTLEVCCPPWLYSSPPRTLHRFWRHGTWKGGSTITWCRQSIQVDQGSDIAMWRSIGILCYALHQISQRETHSWFLWTLEKRWEKNQILLNLSTKKWLTNSIGPFPKNGPTPAVAHQPIKPSLQVQALWHAWLGHIRCLEMYARKLFVATSLGATQAIQPPVDQSIQLF